MVIPKYFNGESESHKKIGMFMHDAFFNNFHLSENFKEKFSIIKSLEYSSINIIIGIIPFLL